MIARGYSISGKHSLVVYSVIFAFHLILWKREGSRQIGPVYMQMRVQEAFQCKRDSSFRWVSLSLPRHQDVIIHAGLSSNNPCGSFYSDIAGIMPSRPIVLSGPSGGGKSTILSRAMKDYPNSFAFSVSREFALILF